MLQAVVRFALGVLIGAGLAGGAQAKDPLLKCDLKALGTFRGTPAQVVVFYKEGQDRMVVYDSMLKALDRDPVLGTVKRETEKTLVIAWSLNNARASNGAVFNVKYSLNYDKASGRARISGQPGGIPDSYSGIGSCVFEK